MTYGTTIKLNDKFDFDIDSLSKGLSLITDTDNLSQSMKLLLNINEGEIKFVPTYGIKMDKILGRATPIYYVEYLISKALLKDTRVASIIDISTIKVNDTLNMDIKIQSNINAIVNLRGIIIW